MYILGTPTKTTFLAVEPNKIYLEFTADVVVRFGQPVKLTATGEVTPWAAVDGIGALIGYCYSDAAADELVTVVTRGYAVINVITAAALPAGPVDYSSYDSATDINGLTGYNKYAAGTAASNAWLLDATGAANVLARALMRD